MWPKWVPGGLRGGPGGLWAALGRGGRILNDLGAFWEAFWEPKKLKIGAKIEPEIQQHF